MLSLCGESIPPPPPPPPKKKKKKEKEKKEEKNKVFDHYLHLGPLHKILSQFIHKTIVHCFVQS